MSQRLPQRGSVKSRILLDLICWQRSVEIARSGARFGCVAFNILEPKAWLPFVFWYQIVTAQSKLVFRRSFNRVLTCDLFVLKGLGQGSRRGSAGGSEVYCEIAGFLITWPIRQGMA
jgi:hypothetical protein